MYYFANKHINLVQDPRGLRELFAMYNLCKLLYIQACFSFLTVTLRFVNKTEAEVKYAW